LPFIARWPGKIEAGAVNGELLCLTDLLATCAAIVGEKLPASAGEDSWNALPVLLHGRGGRSSAVLESSSLPLAVRQGDWVWINASRGQNPEPDWFQQQRGYTTNPHPGQLYNLRDDLPERHNYYAEQPDQVRELTALLEKYKKEGRSTPAAP
jgi:arylsulfatase A-like enzyme